MILNIDRTVATGLKAVKERFVKLL